MEHKTGTATIANEAGSLAPSMTEDAASLVGRKTENAVSYVGQKTIDAAPYVGNKAQDAVSYVGHTAEDAASFVGRKTSRAGVTMGSSLRSIGHTVRDGGPDDGLAGGVSSAVADTFERSGRFLQEERIEKVMAGATNWIRRNPIPALLLGVAAGYTAGRAISRRS